MFKKSKKNEKEILENHYDGTNESDLNEETSFTSETVENEIEVKVDVEGQVEEKERTKQILDVIKNNINATFFGNKEIVNNLLIAFIAGGHVLLESVPGTGKTTLAKALISGIDLSYKRIQFTPDTMPSDIVGYHFYNQKFEDFEYIEGGVFANIVLADEINRTNPKVQSALLEAMEERQVSVDSKTYQLPDVFIIIATQNPVEQYGVSPLPEAQLDRFFMKFDLTYLNENDELSLLINKNMNRQEVFEKVSEEDFVYLKKSASNVYVSDEISKYLLDIIRKTRADSRLKLGASTRSAVQMLAAAKARALFYDRNFVTPDDIKNLIKPCLQHKIILTQKSKMSNITTEQILKNILDSVPIPTNSKTKKSKSEK